LARPGARLVAFSATEVVPASPLHVFLCLSFRSVAEESAVALVVVVVLAFAVTLSFGLLLRSERRNLLLSLKRQASDHGKYRE
jgi:hypothetical protein